MYKIRDWIPENKVRWWNLMHEPKAIDYLEKNPSKINWNSLASNPAAIHLLEKNLNRIYGEGLSSNPNAIRLLEKNPRRINWRYLPGNPNAVHLVEKKLESDPDVISGSNLSKNPNAIHLIERYPDKICWFMLSGNPNAIHILINNLDKVDFWNFSKKPAAIPFLLENPQYIHRLSVLQNPRIMEIFHLLDLNDIHWPALCGNPHAIPLIERYFDRFHNVPYVHQGAWVHLSSNPNALHILQKYPKCIDWYFLLDNPGIFEYDYKSMKEAHKELMEDIIKARWHPDRVAKMIEQGLDPNEL